MTKEHRKIGFVSTRLAGTDGVSLETLKWVSILNKMGHECCCFAGESDWPEDRAYVVPEAHFAYPEVQALQVDLFDDYVRSPETSRQVQALKELLKDHLYKFVHTFDLDLLVAENILAIPMHVPLGLALTEFIAETDFQTIGHHHDFGWERRRFKVSAASDYQLGAFPPILHSVHHVVINSYGARQLALRTGATSILVPNVMDFDIPPAEPDGYAADLRAVLGIGPDEYLLLQPTRVVPRKRIEHAIELTSRLCRAGLTCSLVISHSSGDEGTDYEDHLASLAEIMGVRLVFASGIIGHQRGKAPHDSKIYSLADAYEVCDLVTYPSTVEGFGNAFLETIYYRRPIVMASYEIFKRDIEPKAFQVIPIEDFITPETVARSAEVLRNPDLAAEMCQRNYELGRRYYSYHVLEDLLTVLLYLTMGD
jgi:glycosyltransferase involved in cell wall biosynthesis